MCTTHQSGQQWKKITFDNEEKDDILWFRASVDMRETAENYWTVIFWHKLREVPTQTGFTGLNPASLGTIKTCRHTLSEVYISCPWTLSLSQHSSHRTPLQRWCLQSRAGLFTGPSKDMKGPKSTSTSPESSQKQTEYTCWGEWCLQACYFSLDSTLLFSPSGKPASKVDEYLLTIYIIDKDRSQYGA